jgi:riboflavin transporter FmnP
MNTYQIFLYLHSWVRWIILILGIIAIIKAYAGWLGHKPYTKGDNGISAAFMGSLHLNLLLGLSLYLFLSPYTQTAFQDFGAAMKNSELRFWAVEHISINIIAVVLATVGRSKSKKAVDTIRKHKLTAIFYTIAFILLLISIPWQEAARLIRL